MKGVSHKKGVRKDSFKDLLKLILFTIIVIVIALAVYFVFFSTTSCKDTDCYENALLKCKRVTFVNEDDTAVWGYKILGKEKGNACRVEVKLLRLIQGTIDIEYLQNKEMVCIVQKLGDSFPEEDMTKCSGPLREEFQEIIIDRMHNYLLNNIGEIRDEFQGV
ncbi:MAG: hypothetical protein ABIH37_03360 [archaeon]